MEMAVVDVVAAARTSKENLLCLSQLPHPLVVNPILSRVGGGGKRSIIVHGMPLLRGKLQ